MNNKTLTVISCGYKSKELKGINLDEKLLLSLKRYLPKESAAGRDYVVAVISDESLTKIENESIRSGARHSRYNSLKDLKGIYGCLEEYVHVVCVVPTLGIAGKLYNDLSGKQARKSELVTSF